MFLCWCLTASAASTNYARHIADLIAPAKLATLVSWGANPRVQKAGAQLEAARISGLKVEKVAAEAVAIAGYKDAEAKLKAFEPYDSIKEENPEARAAGSAMPFQHRGDA